LAGSLKSIGQRPIPRLCAYVPVAFVPFLQKLIKTYQKSQKTVRIRVNPCLFFNFFEEILQNFQFTCAFGRKKLALLP